MVASISNLRLRRLSAGILVGLALASAGAARADDPQPAADSSTSLYLNALGPLQFGLAPTLELGRKTTVLLRLRALNLGLAYQLLAKADDEKVKLGLGGGVGVHTYFGSTPQHGFYLGGMGELVYSDTEDDTDDLARYQYVYAVPTFHTGYRWHAGSFLLGLGLEAGAAVPVSGEAKPIGPDGCAYSDSCGDPSTYAIGMLVFDVGWRL
ncbi:MAG TPA: hypothetical protein VEB43_16900 [Anaeromyxobacter sp.]|nr:hypothetical protein [Anaeromyxobacter sp.]